MKVVNEHLGLKKVPIDPGNPLKPMVANINDHVV
jgi:hypothetical protein